jgi:hypothetical protein
VVATHLNQLIAMNAAEMFGLDEARKLLDTLKDAAPQLVDGLTPGTLSLTQISALCRALLSEGIALKDFRLICEAMVDAARRYNRIVQTGSQSRSNGRVHFGCEVVRQGRIGQVREVHVTCGPPSVPCDLPAEPVPDYLDWDLWLGPAAERPYHPMYAPFTWRGWTPFGTGCIGDWVCHVVDPVFWALDLVSNRETRAMLAPYGGTSEAMTVLGAEAKKRGATEVEPTPEAQDAWVTTIKKLSVVNRAYLESCTPGYYNNEGDLEGGQAGQTYAPGINAFNALLADWRNNGELQGLALRA